MHTIRITFANGASILTIVRGTVNEITETILGERFAVGDTACKAVKIDFLAKPDETIH